MSTTSTEETLAAPAPDNQLNSSAAVVESAPDAASTEVAVPQVVAKEGTPFDKMVQDGTGDGAGNSTVALTSQTATASQASPSPANSDGTGAPAQITSEVTPQEVSAQASPQGGALQDADAATPDGSPDGSAARSDGQINAGQSGANTKSTETAAPTHVDASLEIDHRRAKQLLDRALLLSERGDFAGAILAARQAVVLTPTSPTGHSMLGLLHERAGDLEKAIASYEKVVQLAPHSTLERDSLERLKATLAQENASVIFHFDDNELFEEPAALPAPIPPRATASSASSAAADAALASSLPSVSSAARASSPVGVASTPVIPGRTSAGPPVLAPLTGDMPDNRTPVLRALSQRPSFYFKTVPLVATTALGLLFMAWAQGVSQSKRISELPVATAPPAASDVPRAATPTSGEPTTPPANGALANGATTSGNPTPPPPGTAVGGDIFGSGKSGAVAQVGKAVVAPPAPGRSTSRPATSGARPSSTGSTGTTTAPLPPTSTSPIIPQPAAPSGSSGGSGGSGSSAPFAGLGPLTPRSDNAPAVRSSTGGSAPAAAPVVPAPAAPAAPVPAPGDGGGNSRGGAFFNPGSQPRGVIRVDPVRPAGATAPRPSNLVRRAESSAAAAAAQGNNNRVIGAMSDSIQRTPTAYAYQRRAMGFLNQGDYGRAADDFQSAIAAYNDQINRNQDVGEARNGLSACQSGLRMALSNMRR